MRKIILILALIPVSMLASGCGSADTDGAPTVSETSVISCYSGKGRSESCWVRFSDASVCLRSKIKNNRHIYSDCSGPSVPAPGREAAGSSEAATDQ